jgi:hypothetical protein
MTARVEQDVDRRRRHWLARSGVARARGPDVVVLLERASVDRERRARSDRQMHADDGSLRLGQVRRGVRPLRLVELAGMRFRGRSRGPQPLARARRVTERPLAIPQVVRRARVWQQQARLLERRERGRPP